MISFFTKDNNHVFAVESEGILSSEIIKKLEWLFSNSSYIPAKIIKMLKVAPMLTRLNKYPICKSGSLKISENTLKTP